MDALFAEVSTAMAGGVLDDIMTIVQYTFLIGVSILGLVFIRKVILGGRSDD